MDATPLTDAEESLLDHVADLNARTFDPDFFDGGHVVAAGVRTADGEIHDGVSLPTSVGRASTCAEPVALGSAVAAGHAHDAVESCVAVAYPMPDHEADAHHVVPPCGVCRELLVDYNPDMRVVVPVGTDGERVDEDGDELRAVRAEDLLPVRTW